ncbi:MAG: WG repeat-containing protein [Chthoniobacterales bacterium]
MAQALIERTWYYVKRDGATLPVITYDNGADYFSEGLVRSRLAGKIAYFNKQFEQVIPPRYDWGWPFENGKALVCVGCAEAAPDADQHTMMQGGRWGYINHSAREVVGVTHSFEEIMKWKRQP